MGKEGNLTLSEAEKKEPTQGRLFMQILLKRALWIRAIGIGAGAVLRALALGGGFAGAILELRAT